MHVYDCAEKQAARDEVYRHLAAEAGGNLLILPGPRRWEIDTAVHHGFTIDKMVLVERNHAIKANLTRQFTGNEQDAVKSALRAGWLSEVCEQLVSEGTELQAAHLDFCEPIETLNVRSPRVEIERFVATGVMRNGLLAVTVLNGRVADFTEKDRLKMLRYAVSVRFNGTVKRMVWGKYWNPVKNSPMLWAIYRLKYDPNAKPNWWK